MDSINTKVAAVVGINALIVLALIFNQYHSEPLVDLTHKPIFTARQNDYNESPYTFDDPAAALEILEQVDIYQDIKEGELEGADYKALAGGFDYNNKYCKQHRAYFVDHPEIVFNEVNFVSNYWRSHNLRNEIIPNIGSDLHPEVTAGNKELWDVYKYNFKRSATLFFMHNIFFMKRQVGKQFSCLSQESNHIPGNDILLKQDKLGQSLALYAKKYEPECFNFDKYFSKTLVTQKKNNLKNDDLLFIGNKKVEIRTFLLVASANPVIAFYHDGYYKLDKTYLFFGDNFQQYLLEQGIVTDPNWVENSLIPEYKRAMVHLVRVAQSDFFKISSVFELFAVDFVLDKNLTLWFVKADATPLLQGFSDDSTRLFDKMLTDTFEITIGLLRSRMKRVVNYVNQISSELTPKDSEVPNLGIKRREFKELTLNNFEPEYLPGSRNSFQKIIDENDEGVKRYAGLIRKECL